MLTSPHLRLFAFLLPLLTAPSVLAQCVLELETDIQIELLQADPDGNVTYVWNVTNTKPGNGNETFEVRFGIEMASVVSSSTGCPTCLNAMWSTAIGTIDPDVRSLVFTKTSNDNFNQVTEQFTYTIDDAVASITVQTLQGTGGGQPTPPGTVDANTSPECAAVLADITALPVELSHWAVVANGNTLHVQWTTQAETNSAFFAVQQWHPGGFVDVGTVEAAGMAHAPRTYTLALHDVVPGRQVLRLRQVDLDGQVTYSPQVEVHVDLPEAYHLSAPYPNPFNPSTALTLQVRETQPVRVAAYDILGREVALLHDGAVGSSVQMTFSADHLPGGLYIIRAVGQTFTATRTVVLLK